MAETTCKLLVLGAGPGGYACAIRAGQLGVDTVIVEPERAGGTCLNVGCIPSKALIHVAEQFDQASRLASGFPLGISAGPPRLDLPAAIAWKDGIVGRLTGGVQSLLRKAKVRTVAGHARFRDGKTVEVAVDGGRQVIRAEAVVIATGSRPVELPNLPFGGDVISSAQALSLLAVPGRLAVVGAGYIGLELGTAFAKLGARVTVVEAQGRILPAYDAELTAPVRAHLDRLGVRVVTGAAARSFSAGSLEVEADGAAQRIEADTVLVTVGRRPRLDGWGLEGLALDLEGGHIRVDDRCRTSMRGVYAIGDVTGDPMLAHRAMAQGEMVAAIVAGHRRRWDKRCIPAVCFTDPEIVAAGLSPDEARASGLDVEVGAFPFAANGRSLTTEARDGFVRVVSRAGDHLVLGIQAVGAGVSELSSAFALAIETGARLEDVAGTVHAHPTRGEALQEAALGALGRALHA